MRLSAAAILALAAASANALNVFRGDGQSRITDDDLDVPGKNPLKFCDADRADDIITIEEVMLTPNPPQA